MAEFWCPCAGTRCHATSAGVILQRPEDYTKNRNIPLKDREPLQGARLSADTYQIWQNWRLLELLEALAIRPELEGLRDYDGRISKATAYVLKFSGWVNRLNKIREHFLCRSCGEIMVADQQYARFNARYNVTVIKCRIDVAHGEAYLNHCWYCEEVIDSRDNLYSVPDKEGRKYLCLQCGSGPMEHDKYAQGDICPKCGFEGMKTLRTSHLTRICRNASCGHKIQLPMQSKRTGPRCPKCNDVTFNIGREKRWCLTCHIKTTTYEDDLLL